MNWDKKEKEITLSSARVQMLCEKIQSIIAELPTEDLDTLEIKLEQNPSIIVKVHTIIPDDSEKMRQLRRTVLDIVREQSEIQKAFNRD